MRIAERITFEEGTARWVRREYAGRVLAVAGWLAESPCRRNRSGVPWSDGRVTGARTAVGDVEERA